MIARFFAVAGLMAAIVASVSAGRPSNPPQAPITDALSAAWLSASPLEKAVLQLVIAKIPAGSFVSTIGVDQVLAAASPAERWVLDQMLPPRTEAASWTR